MVGRTKNASNKNSHSADYVPSVYQANTVGIGSGMDFTSFFPTIFNNPYNDNDYDIFEDIWANTPAGRALDQKVKDVVTPFKPRFKFKDKTFETEEAENQALAEYDKELNELIRIDNLRTIKIVRKVRDAYRNRQIYGRSILAFERPKGRLAVALKPIHSRWIGRVFTHRLDWSLSSVRVFRKGENIKAEDMIYFVNMENAAALNSMHYGYSEFQRISGEARAYRKINEFDIPEAAEVLWANQGIIRVDNDGLTPAEKTADLKAIKKGLRAGKWSLINGKKDEIEAMSLSLEPQLAQLIEASDRYERTMFANAGVPAAIMGREEDANRATLLGKLRFYLQRVVDADRTELGETLAEQWYEPNLFLINPELKDILSVEVEFEPVPVENWQDLIEGVLKLKELTDQRAPVDELLKMIQLEDLASKLDEPHMADTSEEEALAKRIQQEKAQELEIQNEKNRIENESLEQQAAIQKDILQAQLNHEKAKSENQAKLAKVMDGVKFEPSND